MTEIGEETQLFVTGYDGDTTWKSSDDSVATVADGLVTAVGKGDATITLETEDATLSCIVSVAYKGMNPVLPPSWRLFIPDGEPRNFNGVMYIYGSKDTYGQGSCSDSYHVIYSSDLVHWTDAGESFSVRDLPAGNGNMTRLWAPDCVYNPATEKYYLFSCGRDQDGKYFIAESDVPTGPFTNAREITYKGERIGNIDPGVLVDDDGTMWLAIAGTEAQERPMPFGGRFRYGKLDPETNYSTVIDGSVIDVHDSMIADGFHPFEGPSLRKFNDIYYLIYVSSRDGAIAPSRMSYLYSTDISKNEWQYGGTLIDTYDLLANVNVHGSIEYFNGEYYISYHRLTPGVGSRSFVLEKISLGSDGKFSQAKVTSSGAKGSFTLNEDIKAASACVLSGGRNDRRFTSRPAAASPTGYEQYAYGYFNAEGQYFGFSSVNLGFSARMAYLNVKTTAPGAVVELSTSPDGAAFASFALPNTGNEWREISTDITGFVWFTQDVYVRLRTVPESGRVDFDQFSINSRPKTDPNAPRLNMVAFMTEIGEETRLIVSGYEGDVTWSSSDESVAIITGSGGSAVVTDGGSAVLTADGVDGGVGGGGAVVVADGVGGGGAVVTADGSIVITAVGKGDATITADTGAYQLTCIVSVGYEGQNPVLPPSWRLFIPDGEPHNFNGVMYVYGSKDPYGSGSCSESYHSIYSTDLIHWVDAGTSFSLDDLPPGNEAVSALWAPDCFYDPATEKYYLLSCGTDYDGKYYIASSDSPSGPFKNAREITYQGGQIGNIDPGALVDDDGTVWLAIAGNESQERPMPFGGRFRYGKLDPETGYTTVIDGSMIDVNDAMFADGFHPFEGPSFRKFNGIYYLIYVSSRDGAIAPSRLSYLYTTDIAGGEWTYGGTIVDTYDLLRNVNVHGSIEYYNGEYYAGFHRLTPGVGSRSYQMEKITIGEDGLIAQAELTSSGPKGAFSQGERIQAASAFMLSGGRDDLRFAARPAATSPTGYEQYAYGYFNAVSQYFGYRYVDFGDAEVGALVASVRTTGGNAVLTFKDAPDGNVISVLNLPDTQGEWQDVIGSVPASPEGKQAVYVELTAAPNAGRVELDWFSFDGRATYAEIDSPARMNVRLRSTAQLQFSVDGVGYEFVSSNPGIVRVDHNGVVTPVRAGSAVVSIRTIDGSGLVDSVLVNVTP
jgi:beta-xylosidase